MSEAKQKARGEASRQKQNKKLLTRSFASRFKLRFAQLFLAKLKLTIILSLSLQGLTERVGGKK